MLAEKLSFSFFFFFFGYVKLVQILYKRYVAVERSDKFSPGTERTGIKNRKRKEKDRNCLGDGYTRCYVTAPIHLMPLHLSSPAESMEGEVTISKSVEKTTGTRRS